MSKSCAGLQYKSMSPARNFESQYETLTDNINLKHTPKPCKVSRDFPNKIQNITFKVRLSRLRKSLTN